MTTSLSLGKIRGLSEIADHNGILAMTALDHRQSLRRALEQANPQNASYEAVVDFKLQVLLHLAPRSTAVLIDPIYGLAEALVKGYIPGQRGFIVSLEETGYVDEDGERLSKIEHWWSIAKIKRIGASAVKILLYYHPRSKTASRQEDFISGAARACEQLDIPLIVEPISYSLPDEPKKGTADFARIRPQLVIETARRLAPLGVDLLKCEFPVDVAHEGDPSAWADHCSQLTDVIAIPWVLLSAGVEYETFREQVRIACASGASGFLAGRAIWKEAITLQGRDRDHFLASHAIDRLNELYEIAASYARPWHLVYEEAMQAIDVSEGWHRRYGEADFVAME